MKHQLVVMVALTAALSSALSVGVAQVATPASAAAHAPEKGVPPSDTQLLAQIAANTAKTSTQTAKSNTQTAKTNSELAGLGSQLRSLLTDENQIEASSKTSALRAKFINQNLLAFSKALRTDFSYQDPSQGSSAGNEQHVQEQTLCQINYWLQKIYADGDPTLSIGPCD